MGAGSTIASQQSKKDFKASFKPEAVKECKEGCYSHVVYDGHFLNTHEPYQIAECFKCKRHVLRTGYYIERR
jgi:hypothetical protein